MPSYEKFGVLPINESRLLYLLPGGHLFEEAVRLPVGIDAFLVLVGGEEADDTTRDDVTEIIHDSPQLMHLKKRTDNTLT